MPKKSKQGRKKNNLPNKFDARKNFSKWYNEGRPTEPLFTRNNATCYNPKDKKNRGEKIIPIYDYRNRCTNTKYYVTEKSGNVISGAQNKNKLTLLTLTYDSNSGYTNCQSWKLHRLVLFSFLYDQVKNGIDHNINTFGVDFSKVNVEDVVGLLNNEFEVHHIDGNKTNNELSNLSLLESDVHKILTNLGQKMKKGTNNIESDNELLSEIFEHRINPGNDSVMLLHGITTNHDMVYEFSLAEKYKELNDFVELSRLATSERFVNILIKKFCEKENKDINEYCFKDLIVKINSKYADKDSGFVFTMIVHDNTIKLIPKENGNIDNVKLVIGVDMENNNIVSLEERK